MSKPSPVIPSAGSNGPVNSSDLLVQVYDELRRLAASRLAREAEGFTLQATALVHEAWLKLSRDESRTWENRAHFFGAAAHAMRQILIDVARRKQRLKRGSGQATTDLGSIEVADNLPTDDLLRINEALDSLEREDPGQARIVVLKFFGGMTNEEVAEYLGISERTVYRHWVCAKARLYALVRQPE